MLYRPNLTAKLQACSNDGGMKTNPPKDSLARNGAMAALRSPGSAVGTNMSRKGSAQVSRWAAASSWQHDYASRGVQFFQD